ncbi:MAG: hypothetical protein WA813_12380, partial [Beijerinckiaceae bacterium]
MLIIEDHSGRFSITRVPWRNVSLAPGYCSTAAWKAACPIKMRVAVATISSSARKQRGSEITLLFRLPLPRETLRFGNLVGRHFGGNHIPLGAPGTSPIAAVEAFPRLNGSNDRLILRGERH